MKSFVLVTVLVAALAASVAATIDLYFDHTELHPGTTYKLEWDTDHDYVRIHLDLFATVLTACFRLHSAVALA